MYDYLEVKRWRKRRKLKNPIKGNFLKNPWSLAIKLTWLLINTITRAILSMWLGIFERVIMDATGIRRPQVLPKWPQRIIFWLCGVTTGFFFLALYSALIQSYQSTWIILSITVACHTLIWFWLRRNFPPVTP